VDRLENSMIFKMGQMEKTPAPETAPSPPASRRVVQKQEKPTFHVVKPGENLYRIGLKYGLSTNEVRRLNNLAPNAVIHVGQKLTVGKAGQN
ncbi:MAG: LysM domain-containing protein, partial [Pseudomonadota bacterium]